MGLFPWPATVPGLFRTGGRDPGMESEGDIRVLLALDLVLSFAFSYVVVMAFDLAGIGAFSWRNVAGATVILAVITYFAVLRQ